MQTRLCMSSLAMARLRVLHRPRVFLTSRRGLKESCLQTEDFEKHKKDSLAKQRSGKGHWKPELATDSEEAVRADRMEGSVKDLLEKTKMAAEEKAKAGTSTGDDSAL